MKRSFVLLIIASLTSAAVINNGNEQTVFAPQSYEHVEGFSLNLNAMRLVQLEGQPPRWMSELEKIELRAKGFKFFDITDTQELESAALLRPQKKKSAFPKSANATDIVEPLIKTLKTSNMKENLVKFTSFRTRYYRSETGKQSQKWLASRISEITAQFASKSLQERISISEFSHPWGQNSIIAKINGTSSDDRIVVVGAHQDSTHSWPFLPAPGADDDGSGTVTILEAYRALLAADFTPSLNVEFHWYAAEEGGLLGSQAVVADYVKNNANVFAMSQFDMTAWVKTGVPENVGVITDFVDADLVTFNKMLVDEYLNIGWVETKCGYACSDHASWTKAGYSSIFSIENAFEHTSPYIHSGEDRIDKSDQFSFEHMLEFSKLAAAFVVELAI